MEVIFRSYLSNGSQFVSIYYASSDTIPVLAGVTHKADPWTIDVLNLHQCLLSVYKIFLHTLLY